MTFPQCTWDTGNTNGSGASWPQPLAWMSSAIPSHTPDYIDPPLHTLPLYGHIAPLPEQFDVEVGLHPALKHTYTPVMIYNLLDHPRTAYVNSGQRSPFHDWADENATSPGTSNIIIRVPCLDRPIVVNVMHDHERRYPVTTINDILEAIYRGLRVEAIQLLCSRGNMAEVLFRDASYVHLEQDESRIRQAITRILGGRIFWDGLTPSTSERDVWILQTR